MKTVFWAISFLIDLIFSPRGRVVKMHHDNSLIFIGSEGVWRYGPKNAMPENISTAFSSPVCEPGVMHYNCEHAKNHFGIS